ncbi:MAG TPA: N-6 DNA methylase [Sedimentisphaerales bacterium]|nr:N-6 DNA methylase [Sedimentisphaerales bacterium]
MASINNIVQKLWGLCDILRDDGITYYQYVNELTYLLFLKIAQEKETEKELPRGYRWSDLVSKKSAQERFDFYLELLVVLGTRGSTRVRAIFAHPTSLIPHPMSLDLLVKKMDTLDWYNARREGFGDLYEDLLQKHANEAKGGAGQYFTPRPLIECMVNVTRPETGEIIQDPAAGTCGFLVAVDAYIKNKIGKQSNQRRSTSPKTIFHAVELNQDTYRLALMNTMLHNIKGEIKHGDTLSPMGADLDKADVILTNPPFGSKKGSGRASREDLPFPTFNKQFAFLQHIYLGLKPGGRAAVVLPDNVLFEENTGKDIRADLMDKCNLHTILRLPTGIFYAQGVKTNVLFFTRCETDKDNTKKVWIYDMRANMPRFGKRSPLKHEYFEEFEKCYGNDPNGRAKRRESDSNQDRWRKFTIKEIREHDFNLEGFKWLKDEDVEDSDQLPEPAELVTDAIAELDAALGELNAVSLALENGNNAMGT